MLVGQSDLEQLVLNFALASWGRPLSRSEDVGGNTPPDALVLDFDSTALEKFLWCAFSETNRAAGRIERIVVGNPTLPICDIGIT
jgi:hypothetical protein